MTYLHLRNLPHLFNPALVPPSAREVAGAQTALLCLLDPKQLETELAQLLALANTAANTKASAEVQQNCVWKILLLPQPAEHLAEAQRILAAAPLPLPPLELHIQPLHQWPPFFASVQACLCLSRDPELRLKQAVMALSMDLPVYLPESVEANPHWSALPVEIWPPQPFLQAQMGSESLRERCLKALQLTQTLSQASLNATEMAVFVYWGRSGSVFLQSLFDQHPEVLSTPATVLMRFYDFWSELVKTLVEKQAQFDLNDFLNLFCSYFASLFYAQPDSSTCCLDQLGPQQDTVLQVDVPAFKEAFVWLIQLFFPGDVAINSRIFFLVVHYAYEMAQGRDISEKHLIAYQLHQPILNHASTSLFADFPETRVLGIAREPMRALFSHLRMYRDNRRTGTEAPQRLDYDYLDMVLDGTYLTYYTHQLAGWKALQGRYQPRLYEMILEKLHAKPEAEMRKLAEWLQIAWHPCLLQSSFNGLAYWGDRRAYQKIQGFSAAHPLSDDWESCFGPLDKEILYALLPDDVKRQGYGSAFPFVKLLLPLLIFLPTRLERQALEQALHTRNTQACENWLLHLLERWKVSFMALFGREI